MIFNSNLILDVIHNLHIYKYENYELHILANLNIIKYYEIFKDILKHSSYVVVDLQLL